MIWDWTLASSTVYERKIYRYLRGGYVYGYSAAEIVTEAAIRCIATQKIQEYLDGHVNLISAKEFYLKALSKKTEQLAIDLLRKERSSKRGNYDWHISYEASRNELRDDLLARQIKAHLKNDELRFWKIIEDSETHHEVRKKTGLSPHQFRAKRSAMIERIRSEVLGDMWKS